MVEPVHGGCSCVVTCDVQFLACQKGGRRQTPPSSEVRQVQRCRVETLQCSDPNDDVSPPRAQRDGITSPALDTMRVWHDLMCERARAASARLLRTDASLRVYAAELSGSCSSACLRCRQTSLKADGNMKDPFRALSVDSASDSSFGVASVVHGAW